MTMPMQWPKSRGVHTVCWLLITLALQACVVSVTWAKGDSTWQALVETHRHNLSRDGYTLHYIDLGKGSPVVMVHGFADSTYTWHKNVRPLLGAGLRLIMVDLPGMGRSTIPPSGFTFSVENLSREVMALVRHLKLQRFNLVGSSMGGGICLNLCFKYPSRIERTVVIDPACYLLPKFGLHSLLDLPGADYLAPKVAGRWAARFALEDVYWDTEKIDEALVEEFAKPLAGKGRVEVLTRLYEDYFSTEFQGMANGYYRLRTPLLIIWGAHDTWIPLSDGKKLHAKTPNSQLHVIDKAGHLPYQERPDAVNPLLIRFLTDG
jgi:pimeloyl-ACP methyl ester carboxylesterase